MVRDYYEKICSGNQVRQNLINLKECIKNESEKRAFAYLLGGDFRFMIGLLDNEDPKIRKNAALILGKMESEDLLPILFDTYKKEATLFIRADYLKAISEMEYRSILPELEICLKRLRETSALPEEEKHLFAEIRILQAMVTKYQCKKNHKFIAEEKPTDILMITNRCQREVTARQITQGTVTMMAGGLRVKDAMLKEVFAIRTWSELLFPIAAAPLKPEHPEHFGRILTGSVLEKLKELYAGEHPFLYRIELKSAISPEKKGAYIRRISDSLEQASGGMLINSTTEYEIEIRFLTKKDGTFVPMLKLYSLPERRFAYRKESIASSMAPVNAALTVELAKPYLKEDAQILDPFCGVGTMLLERNYCVHAGTMYGIDLYGEAIERAKINTECAGVTIYYINKDFFEFSHEYLFDEIITDFPQVTASKNKNEIKSVYQTFFAHVKHLLKDEAILILYVTEPQMLLEAIRNDKQYIIEETFLLNEKNRTTVFVIRLKK